MKCSQCNEEMKKGYIHSSGRIFWSENEEVAIIGGEEILVGMPMLKMRKLTGYRCQKCKIVIFEYNR